MPLFELYKELALLELRIELVKIRKAKITESLLSALVINIENNPAQVKDDRVNRCLQAFSGLAILCTFEANIQHNGPVAQGSEQ